MLQLLMDTQLKKLCFYTILTEEKERERDRLPFLNFLPVERKTKNQMNTKKGKFQELLRTKFTLQELKRPQNLFPLPQGLSRCKREPCQRFMNSPAVIVIQAEVCSTHFTNSQLLLLK